MPLEHYAHLELARLLPITPRRRGGGGGVPVRKHENLGEHGELLQSQLQRAQESLAHASRLAVVGELTAMVAHEVNQPLTAILHNAEAGVKFLNLPKVPMDEIRSILTDIMENEVRASQSIHRIRTLLQKREMEVQPLNLNEVASDVLRLVTGDALRRRIEIKSNLDPQLPLICGDRIHLQQVLLNLILNAMDAKIGRAHV